MDDLARRLEDELAREHAEREPDVGPVLHRGKRLRLYRNGGIAGSAVALLVVSGLAFSATTRDGSEGMPIVGATEVAEGSGPIVEEMSEKDEAEIFAFRAVARSGLMSPYGDPSYVFTYADDTTSSSDGAWRVGFVRSDCAPEEGNPDPRFACTTDVERESLASDELPQADVFIVVRSDGESWTVLDAEGNVTEEDRSQLRGFTLPHTPEPSQWDFSAVDIFTLGDRALIDSFPLWVGAIPSEAAGSMCALTVFDDENKVTFSREFIEAPPPADGGRGGGLRGLENRPASETATATVECEQLVEPDELTNEEARPYEPDPEREVTILPDGPRYAVAKGTFDDSWGEYSGTEWRFMVWGNHVTYCRRLEIGNGMIGNEGATCTTPGDGPYSDRHRNEPFGGHFYFPAGIEFARAIAGGAVSSEVDLIEISYEYAGKVIQLETLDAPNQTTIKQRFFIAFLPPEECGTITAFDKDGDELARKPLQRGGCD